MKLLYLAARVCKSFNSNNVSQLRTVQKVKDNQCRDIVTELDMKLHHLSVEFVAEYLPGCSLLSEEGDNSYVESCHLIDGEWLIVDPLDGSNNYSMGFPNFGYMAAYVKNGILEGAVVVIPEHHQYLVFEDSRVFYAQPMPIKDWQDNGTVYYAYPPKQDIAALSARAELQKLIDQHSAGMYRYGSACSGLYHLMEGKHMAFIGHGIRIWDALAFLPLLASQQINVRYSVSGLTITLFASKNINFLESSTAIVCRHQGVSLNEYLPSTAIRLET
jgi:myo-inositol-1(or 4)-monophosphatase